MTAFTLINLLLALFFGVARFPFSAQIARVQFLAFLTELDGNILYVLAGAILAVYFLCWLLSKWFRPFMLLALLLFALDSAAFIWGIFSWRTGIDAAFIAEIGFQIWIMLALISGVISWMKLRGVNLEDLVEEPEAPIETSAVADVEMTNKE